MNAPVANLLVNWTSRIKPREVQLPQTLGSAVSNTKFTSGQNETLDLLLVSNNAMSIFHLRVPTAYVRDNLAKFYVRNDKDSVSLELSSCNTQLFQDARSGGERLSFSVFL